jgi:glyoxylase-like metal-dependent hydrolase (beta-lactamase superfamily II)
MDYTLTNQVDWLPNQGWDERIHIAQNGDLVYVFVLVTERYVILVDTLLNATTANALVEYAKPYLTGRQLLVINSHADWDHAWGNQLFAGPHALYPVPIIAHAAGTARYRDDETVAYLAEVRVEHPEIFGDVILTPPTVTFTHDLWIDGGDLTLHLFPTPGHTPDHISIFIPEISTLLAGDATELPFPMPWDASNLPLLRASLQAMADLAPRQALYCHAPPEIGPQLLHDNIDYFNQIEAVCRTALADGFDATPFTDAELPGALNCRFEDILPTTGAWADVSEAARTKQHGEPLRTMLAWLLQQEGANGAASHS